MNITFKGSTYTKALENYLPLRNKLSQNMTESNNQDRLSLQYIVMGIING